MSILNKLREKNEVVNLRLLNKLLKAGNTYVFDDGKCLTAKQVGEFLKGTTRYKIVTDSKHDTRLGGLKSISARVYVYNKKGEEHSLLIDAFITKENKKDNVIGFFNMLNMKGVKLIDLTTLNMISEREKTGGRRGSYYPASFLIKEKQADGKIVWQLKTKDDTKEQKAEVEEYATLDQLITFATIKTASVDLNA